MALWGYHMIEPQHAQLRALTRIPAGMKKLEVDGPNFFAAKGLSWRNHFGLGMFHLMK
jgi:hypothetical protein